MRICVQPRSTRKAWIQELSKERLAAELLKLGLSPDGTLEVLRHRMRTYVERHPGYGPVSTETPADEEHSPGAQSAPPIEPTIEAGKLLSQLRKWGIAFDGRDPVGFLEHLEEMSDAAGLPQNLLLKGLPAILKGDALLWCRNNRDFWRTWEDFRQAFKQQYLPPRYQAQLLREIMSRQQKQNEPFKAYATELLTKMRRAHAVPAEERLERLYENMSPEYKVYIRRHDVRTVNELVTLAAEFEELEEQRRQFRKAPEPVLAAVYSRDECCWKCKQRGHTRQDCRRPARKFCSQCGKDGVLTRDCHPRPGNARRAEESAATTRPAE